MGIRNFLLERNGDGENLMGMGHGWRQFNLPCHSILSIQADGIRTQKSDFIKKSQN